MEAGVDDLSRLGTVAIIGVGLIGGSIGLSTRARRLADRVVGIGRDRAKLAEAVTLGAIDEAVTELEAGLIGAEIAVICTPVGSVAEEAIRCARLGPKGMLVTDAGSTKRAIVEAVDRDETAKSRFIGAHPIAGSERQGVGSARADLFEGRACVLTPTAATDPNSLDRAREFWSSLGCRLFEMTPEAHDRALALTSHLPHVVASALAGSVPGGLLELAAGSYRDGTRVAASDPALWAEIFLANRGPILDALDIFENRLSAFRRALESGDSPVADRLVERGEGAWKKAEILHHPPMRGDR